MPTTIRNLAWLRALKVDGIPDFGSRMHELVQDLVNNDQQLAQQTNSDLDGNPQPPAPLQSVTATPTETGVHVSIVHEGEYYRGNFYHVEYADNPHFTNAFPAYTGPSREIDLPTGSRTIYIQAAPSYGNSAATSWSYHGGAKPQAVTGGTKSALGNSQGSGTGRPGQPRSGFGPVPYRSITGRPPTRNS